MKKLPIISAISIGMRVCVLNSDIKRAQKQVQMLNNIYIYCILETYAYMHTYIHTRIYIFFIAATEIYILLWAHIFCSESRISHSFCEFNWHFRLQGWKIIKTWKQQQQKQKQQHQHQHQQYQSSQILVASWRKKTYLRGLWSDYWFSSRNNGKSAKNRAAKNSMLISHLSCKKLSL